MTQANDDSRFDGGESELSRRYRQLPVDSVPMELDHLILHQARAAVATSEAAPRRSWIRWGFPLGLMGTAVLAATLALDYSRRAPTPAAAVPVVQPESAAPPAAESLSAQTSLPTAQIFAVPATGADQPSSEPAAHSESRWVPAPKTLRTADSGSGPQLPASSVATPSEPQTAAMIAETVPTEVAPGVSSAPALEPAPATIASTEPAQHGANATLEEPPATPDAETQSVVKGLESLRASAMSPAKHAKEEDRLEDIRSLRQTGRKRAADSAWRKFRQDFPDYPVAADDMARPVMD